MSTQGESQEPVTLINPFEVPKGREEECLAIWREAAEVLSQKEGYISTKLHRALSPDQAKFVFVNIAKWQSPAHFARAVSSPDFLEVAAKTKDFPHFPALYSVVYSDETA